MKFATKTGLAKRMLQSAFKAGICPAWFVADEVYSRDAILLEMVKTNPQTTLCFDSEQEATDSD